MISDNRRSHPRYAVELDCELMLEGFPPQICRIQDFCSGGLFLQISTDGAPESLQGAAVTVRFPVDGDSVFRSEASVVRMIPEGLGLAFREANDAAIAFLSEQSDEAREARKREQAAPSGVGGHLRAELRRRCDDFYAELIDHFIATANVRLGEDEELARKDWRLVVESQQHLRNHHESMVDAYRQQLLKDFDQGIDVDELRRPKNEGQGGLSLIEDASFQDWLNITNLISKLEARNEDELFALGQRLAEVLGYAISNENNPCGPLVICHRYQSVLDSVPLEAEAAPVVFKAFEEEALSRLAEFYRQSNEWLVEQGVIPTIERAFSVVKKPSAAAPAPAEEMPPEEAVGDEEPMAEDEAPVAGAPSGAGYAWGAPRPAAAASPGAASSSAPSAGSYAWGAPASPSGAGDAGGYSAAQELMHLSRNTGLAGDRGALASGAAGAAGGAGLPDYSADELSQALQLLRSQGRPLRELSSEGGVAGRLSEAMSRHLGGDEERAIAEPLRDNLEVMERMLTSIQVDPLADHTLKGGLEQLEYPLLQEVLRNDELLKDKSHPVHRVLNTADRLTRIIPSDESGEAMRSRLAEMLASVSEDGELHPERLQDTAEELERLHDSQEQDYQQRIDALIKACEEEELQREASIEVLGDVDDVFAGRPIPLSVLNLLDAGWKNLLMGSYLREGREGERYQSRLDLLDRVISRVAGDREVGGAQAIFDEVKGLLGKSHTPRETLAKALKWLAEDLKQSAADPSSIKSRSMPSMRRTMEAKWRKERRGERPPEYGEEVWTNWLERVRSLERGEMISVYEEGGEPVQQQLVWYDRLHSRYVFAERDGSRGLDVNFGALAERLGGGSVIVLDGWDEPLMDRAAYTMLQSLHDQLLGQASHDNLTGLLNRRAFERLLQDCINDEGLKEGRHHLCYFDLDRFSVVNTTCGHEAGDELVGQIAKLVAESAGEQASAARLGGDEFALLYHDMDAEAALARTEALRGSISAHGFSCEGNSFNISASFGLVTLGATELGEGDEGDSVRSLLSAVDSACYTAKEGGRNRIETFSADNAAINRQLDAMSWVGRMDNLFDSGLIQLKCQKIAPLRYSSARPHYEVLLKVHDEEGKPVSLDAFVTAAEIYDRIHDIDRHVVSNVLDYLRDNHEKLGHIAGLSVNLSGRSIGNVSFMTWLIKRLEEQPTLTYKLNFEITETAAIENLEQAITFVRRLKQCGCNIALDDFGSGTASYTYLKSLPVDFIKIDGSFIKDIVTNIYDFAVVKSVVEMGHTLGKQVVAEYVENAVILAKLKGLGVDYVQGYHIEKPMDLADLARK